MKAFMTLGSKLIISLPVTRRDCPLPPFPFHQCLAKSRSSNAYKEKSASVKQKKVRSGGEGWGGKQNGRGGEGKQLLGS